MGYCKYIILNLFFLASFINAQEKLTVKPPDFNPYKIVHQSGINTENLKGYTESGTYAVTQFPNIRVYSSPYNQTEPSITVSPSSPGNIFIGANTDFGMGYYYSFNSGSNWSGGDIIPNSVYYSTNPYAVYGVSNKIYYNYFDDFIVTDRSTNSGANWTGRIIVPSTSLYDMNSIAVDNNPSSPLTPSLPVHTVGLFNTDTKIISSARTNFVHVPTCCVKPIRHCLIHLILELRFVGNT